MVIVEGYNVNRMFMVVEDFDFEFNYDFFIELICVSFKMDVFSFGVILLEFMFGWSVVLLLDWVFDMIFLCSLFDWVLLFIKYGYFMVICDF